MNSLLLGLKIYLLERRNEHGEFDHFNYEHGERKSDESAEVVSMGKKSHPNYFFFFLFHSYLVSLKTPLVELCWYVVVVSVSHYQTF